MQENIMYCKLCGGFMKMVEGVTLLSNPPKFQYECKDCGHVKYSTEYFKEDYTLHRVE